MLQQPLQSRNTATSICSRDSDFTFFDVFFSRTRTRTGNSGQDQILDGSPVASRYKRLTAKRNHRKLESYEKRRNAATILKCRNAATFQLNGLAELGGMEVVSAF